MENVFSLTNEELMDKLWDKVSEYGLILFNMGCYEKGSEEYSQAMKDMVQQMTELLEIFKEIKQRLKKVEK